MRENVNYYEFDSPDSRRGPRVGPTPGEAVMLSEMADQRKQFFNNQAQSMQVGTKGVALLE